MYVAAKPPLGAVDALVAAAQDQQLDSVFVWDHLQDFFPSAIWDEDVRLVRRAGQLPPRAVRVPDLARLPGRQGPGPAAGGRGHRADPPPPGRPRPGGAHPGAHVPAAADPRHRRRRAGEHRAVRPRLLAPGRPAGGGPADHPPLLRRRGGRSTSRASTSACGAPCSTWRRLRAAPRSSGWRLTAPACSG